MSTMNEGLLLLLFTGFVAVFVGVILLSFLWVIGNRHLDDVDRVMGRNSTTRPIRPAILAGFVQFLALISKRPPNADDEPPEDDI